MKRIGRCVRFASARAPSQVPNQAMPGSVGGTWVASGPLGPWGKGTAAAATGERVRARTRSGVFMVGFEAGVGSGLFGKESTDLKALRAAAPTF